MDVSSSASNGALFFTCGPPFVTPFGHRGERLPRHIVLARSLCVANIDITHFDFQLPYLDVCKYIGLPLVPRHLFRLGSSRAKMREINWRNECVPEHRWFEQSSLVPVHELRSTNPVAR